MERIILYLLMTLCSTMVCQGQISNTPIYSVEEKSGVYCKVPLVQWVIPTVQSIQDRFDLQDFNIILDSVSLVKVINNISEEDLAFDFYYPKESKSKLKPLIIFAHGGAYLYGSRESRPITFLCTEFAQRGYATASIEYRLKALSTFDMLEAGYMALQDGNAAIKYFRANAAKFEIDPDRIFIAGISAGAILALHSGHYEDGEDLLGQTKQLDNALGCFDCTGDHVSVDNSVRGVISIVGATTSPKILNANLPTLHLFCPNDSIVPANQGVPLGNYKVTGLFGSIFSPILKAIKRPQVYGPLYLKNNLALPKHTYADITHYSNRNCSHNIFLADNGVVKSSGKYAVQIINDWIKDLLRPSITLPIRTLSKNSWTRYNLPTSIGSHSVTPNDTFLYRKISNNQFEIRLAQEGQSSFLLNVTDDLGLSTQSKIKFRDTSNSTNTANNTVVANSSNTVVLILLAISFFLAVFLIKKHVF